MLSLYVKDYLPFINCTECLVPWQLGLRTIWEKYFEEAHAVIYVVDAACQSRFEDAKSALCMLALCYEYNWLEYIQHSKSSWNYCFLQQKCLDMQMYKEPQCWYWRISRYFITLSQETMNYNCVKNQAQLGWTCAYREAQSVKKCVSTLYCNLCELSSYTKD